jgi:hypothetical protein
MQTLQSELDAYETMCRGSRKANARLRQLLHALQNSPDAPIHPFLVSDFESRLANYAARLNQRVIDLTELETRVKSTRVLPSAYLDDKGEKTRLLGENELLIQTALYQEQQTIIGKLKLRALHDHRDICLAKRQLSNLKLGEHPEPEQGWNRHQHIHRLKEAIEHEKRRITELESPNYGINEAATRIQKYWRGDRERAKLTRLAAELAALPKQEEQPAVPKIKVPHMDKVDSSDEEYSSSVTDDGFFGVTGVANAEVSSDSPPASSSSSRSEISVSLSDSSSSDTET